MSFRPSPTASGTLLFLEGTAQRVYCSRGGTNHFLRESWLLLVGMMSRGYLGVTALCQVWRSQKALRMLSNWDQQSEVRGEERLQAVELPGRCPRTAPCA